MFLRALALASLIASAVSSFGQMVDINPAAASWIVVPGSIVQVSNKYPVTHLVLYWAKCDQPKGNKLPANKTYTVRVTGAGTSTSAITVSDCTLDFDLTTPSVVPGMQVVQVTSVDSVAPVPPAKAAAPETSFGLINFADPKAGPIPGRPQVDVIWGLIGYHTCKDAFGKDVASNFFCIAVEIGNNSGYAIQIAGMGFKQDGLKTPSSSYLLTRAVAQTGTTEGIRNRSLLALQAGGLMMTGFTPYFHNQRSASRYATATSIVSGPLLAAFNLIFPDLSERQSNNLDDQAFRDGKLIANNTQIRTVVFLDKASLTLPYAACKPFLFSPTPQPATETPDAASARITDDDRRKKILDKKYDDCATEESADSKSVREALGDLVIIGDEIEYLQRVVVDQNVSSQEVATTPRISDTVVKDSTLAVSGTNLTQLPDKLVIVGDTTGIVSATVNTPKSATAVTYTLDKALSQGEGFTIKSTGDSTIPSPIKGTTFKPPLAQ